MSRKIPRAAQTAPRARWPGPTSEPFAVPDEHQASLVERRAEVWVVSAVGLAGYEEIPQGLKEHSEVLGLDRVDRWLGPRKTGVA